jgi:hypothetical protein
MTTKPVMSMASCKAGLDAITALVTATANVKIYTGSQPATTLTAASGTLLSTLPMNATPFPSSSSSGTSGWERDRDGQRDYQRHERREHRNGWVTSASSTARP